MSIGTIDRCVDLALLWEATRLTPELLAYYDAKEDLKHSYQNEKANLKSFAQILQLNGFAPQILPLIEEKFRKWEKKNISPCVISDALSIQESANIFGLERGAVMQELSAEHEAKKCFHTAVVQAFTEHPDSAITSRLRNRHTIAKVQKWYQEFQIIASESV